MTLPPKLLKMRDELALKFVTEYPTMNNRPPDRPDLLEYCFQQGFDKCAELLMPVIVELREALELALSFAPKGPVPAGLSPEFYHTLDYNEEVKLQARIDKACEALNNSKEWCE